MKKLLHCFIILSALVLMLCSVTAAAAASEPLAKVGDQTYTDIEEAWEAVCANGGTIEMLADWTLSSSLDVPEETSIAIEMHGHVMDRNCTQSSDGMSDGNIFDMDDNCALTIIGGDETTEHDCVLRSNADVSKSNILYFHESDGTPYTVTGALITGAGNCNDYPAFSMEYGAALTVSGVTIAGNCCYDKWLGTAHGCIAYAKDYSEIVFDDCDICYNYSSGYGSAVYVNGENTRIYLSNTTISNNCAKIDGGAIYVDDDDTYLSLDNSTICNNYAPFDGGAIFSNKNCLDIKLENNSSISDNTADRDGGAICYANYTDIDATLSMGDGCEISRNTAGSGGGGLYVGGEGLTVIGGTISNNKCTCSDGLLYQGTSFGGVGGGILFYNDRCSVTGTEFAGNYARFGGAIYLYEDECTISDCDIHDNSAYRGGGIEIYLDDNTLSDVSIYNNSAENIGGGVYVQREITLSGIIVIRDNTVGAESTPDNLCIGTYYADSDYTLIFGRPAEGSFIGLSSLKIKGRTQMTHGDGNQNVDVYHSDSSDWHIEAGEDGRVYLAKGAPTYTLTYHISEETTQETVNGKLPDTLPTPDENGDYFLGWYYDADFTKPAKSGDIIYSDTDLYAKFKMYTLTYCLHLQGTQELEKIDVIGDTLPDELLNPENNSTSKLYLKIFYFSGWYYDTGYTKEAHGGDKVTGDVNLYAQLQNQRPEETEEEELPEVSEAENEPGEADSTDTGSVFGDSSVGILIAGIVIILGGAAACILIAKKKKTAK